MNLVQEKDINGSDGHQTCKIAACNIVYLFDFNSAFQPVRSFSNSSRPRGDGLGKTLLIQLRSLKKSGFGRKYMLHSNVSARSE